MTIQHTPGPWYANFHDGDLKMPCAIVTEVGFRIAKMNPTLSIDDTDTAEANARLIAAAPDLLMACKEVLKRVKLDTPGTDFLLGIIALAEAHPTEEANAERIIRYWNTYDDLLAALQEVVRLQFGPRHAQENIVPAWDAARQAIAKAEPKPTEEVNAKD